MKESLQSFSAFVTPIISREVMKYKEQIREHELITKIRIIRAVKREHIPIVQVAKSFSCHRNTVTNLITLFETSICQQDQERLLVSGASLSFQELNHWYCDLLNKSRKPHSHKKAATKDQEEKIVDLFTNQGIKVGVSRMKRHLFRRYEGDTSSEAVALKQLSPGKIRGIYKRNQLTTQTVRSANGERRHLYDYSLLGCFERLHYDVKHILDKHALPIAIYQVLSKKEIPKYEWNIIDAKSRFRFMAYSYNLNASFGLWFLLFTILFLRRQLVAFDTPIIVGEDNGVEFCSGSKRKENDWNDILTALNASVYQYDPRFDIRKNLIERSHLSDDEELFIPRGDRMGTRESFRTEVENYALYWNVLRHHTGIGMQERTPYQVVEQSGLTGVSRLKQFPVLILDEVIDPFMNCIQPLLFEQFAKTHPDLILKASSDPKTKRNLEFKFPFLLDAQNLLTYYQKKEQCTYWLKTILHFFE